MYPHSRMPAYENQSLRDMHGLLQELHSLNASHAPDHLEGWSIMGAAKAATSAAKDLATSASGKSKETEAKWATLGLPARKTVMQNTFDAIMSDISTKAGEAGAWTLADYDSLKTNINKTDKAKALMTTDDAAWKLMGLMARKGVMQIIFNAIISDITTKETNDSPDHWTKEHFDSLKNNMQKTAKAKTLLEKIINP